MNVKLPSLSKEEPASTGATVSSLADHQPMTPPILDVGLPDRSGDILAKEIKALHPSLPPIIASGHLARELRKSMSGDDVVFVDKPYTTSTLLDALRSVGVR